MLKHDNITGPSTPVHTSVHQWCLCTWCTQHRIHLVPLPFSQTATHNQPPLALRLCYPTQSSQPSSTIQPHTIYSKDFFTDWIVGNFVGVLNTGAVERSLCPEQNIGKIGGQVVGRQTDCLAFSWEYCLLERETCGVNHEAIILSSYCTYYAHELLFWCLRKTLWWWSRSLNSNRCFSLLVFDVPNNWCYIAVNHITIIDLCWRWYLWTYLAKMYEWVSVGGTLGKLLGVNVPNGPGTCVLYIWLDIKNNAIIWFRWHSECIRNTNKPLVGLCRVSDGLGMEKRGSIRDFWRVYTGQAGCVRALTGPAWCVPMHTNQAHLAWPNTALLWTTAWPSCQMCYRYSRHQEILHWIFL